MKRGKNNLKKVFIFLGIIIVIFGAIIYLTNMQTNDLYENAITPNELDKELENGDKVTVYFYSPQCSFCQKTSPIVVPLAKDMSIDLKMYDVLENEQAWDEYQLKGTPTIIHFENGQEVARISGYNEEAVFKQWFEENVASK